jgi:hypothetical protein
MKNIVLIATLFGFHFSLNAQNTNRYHLLSFELNRFYFQQQYDSAYTVVKAMEENSEYFPSHIKMPFRCVPYDWLL